MRACVLSSIDFKPFEEICCRSASYPDVVHLATPDIAATGSTVPQLDGSGGTSSSVTGRSAAVKRLAGVPTALGAVGGIERSRGDSSSAPSSNVSETGRQSGAKCSGNSWLDEVIHGLLLTNIPLGYPSKPAHWDIWNVLSSKQLACLCTSRI